MGKTADTIGNFADKLGLVSAFVSTGIGLTVLTPLGRIISTQKISWVYISPVSILAIMTAILVGMYHNAFPPMSGGAFYFCFFFIGAILPPLFMTYGPLFLSNAEYLTSKYNEFQMQLSLVSHIVKWSNDLSLFSSYSHTHTLSQGIFIGSYIIVTIISLFFFSNSVYTACVANYEANYEGVSCSMFM